MNLPSCVTWCNHVNHESWGGDRNNMFLGETQRQILWVLQNILIKIEDTAWARRNMWKTCPASKVRKPSQKGLQKVCSRSIPTGVGDSFLKIQKYEWRECWSPATTVGAPLPTKTAWKRHHLPQHWETKPLCKYLQVTSTGSDYSARQHQVIALQADPSEEDSSDLCYIFPPQTIASKPVSLPHCHIFI